MRNREWIIGVLFVAAMAGLAFAGPWARKNGRHECEFDASRIEPSYRVRIVDCCGRDHEFCCIGCAEMWLKRAKIEPQAIFVTDEASGAELPLESAQFVRSMVLTNAVTGDRIHAFRSLSDAEKHARSAHGQLLGPAERPFLHP